MGNLLKDYYDAVTSGDEYAAMRAEEIKEKIKKREESASWNGTEPDYNTFCEMGG